MAQCLEIDAKVFDICVNKFINDVNGKMEKQEKRTSYGILKKQMDILDEWKKRGMTKDKAINALINFGKDNEDAFIISYVKEQTKNLTKDSDLE